MTGLVAQIGEPYSEIWIRTSELDSPERGRRSVLRSGERMSSWDIHEIYKNVDLGIQVKVEIQSGSSTSNSLTEGLGAELSNETH